MLLVVLAGCRSATAPAPTPPPPVPPPPAAAAAVLDVVEETRRAEEALETVEIETAPIDAPMPAEAPDPAGDPCPAAPADPPDPPRVESRQLVEA